LEGLVNTRKAFYGKRFATSYQGGLLVPTQYTLDQITRYLDGQTTSLGVVGERRLREVLLGVLLAGTLVLTKITRSLDQDDDVRATYKHLDRALLHYDFEPVAREQCRRNCALVREDDVLCLDGSDIAKRFGRKFEALAFIRDGSEKQIVPGYLLTTAVAVRPGGCDKNPVPLLLHPYSAREEGFVSEPYEMHQAIEDIHHWTNGRGIFAIDRAADSGRVLRKLLELTHPFDVRLKAGMGSRYLRLEGRKVLVRDLVETVRYVARVDVERVAAGKRHAYQCSLGSFRVQLRDLEKDGRPLWLVVSKSTKHPEPMALLTTMPADTPEQMIDVLKSYLARWSVEEYHRFVKQSFGLEKVRVFKWARTKNLVHAAFLATALLSSLHRLPGRLAARLRACLIKKAQLVHRRKDSPLEVFNLYAYAAGLAALLRKHLAVLRRSHWLLKRTLSPRSAFQRLSSSRQLAFPKMG
jgi:hypothetical protein